LMSDVMNAVKKLDLEIVEQDFGEIGKLKIAIRQSEVAQTLQQFLALVAKVSTNQIVPNFTIGGLEIALLYARN